MVLHERLLEATGELERLRVVPATDLQIWVELNGFVPDLDRPIELAPPHEHIDLCRHQRRQQRIGLISLTHALECLVEASQRRVHQCHPDVAGGERRLLLDGLEEFSFRFLQAPFEHVQSVRPVAAQLRRQLAERDCTVVRIQELGVDLVGRAHPERGEHQVAGREPVVRPEVSGAFLDGLLEAGDGSFRPFFRPACGEMPPLPNELVRRRYLEAVPDLGAMDHPPPVFSEALLDLSDRDVNRVA